jgi:hypothetical protein
MAGEAHAHSLGPRSPEVGPKVTHVDLPSLIFAQEKLGKERGPISSEPLTVYYGPKSRSRQAAIFAAYDRIGFTRFTHVDVNEPDCCLGQTWLYRGVGGLLRQTK